MRTWTKAALIRAIKTMAQTAVALIGTSVVITDVDWLTVLSASILAGILSMLTSIAGLPEVKDDDDDYDEYYDGEDDDTEWYESEDDYYDGK